MHRAYERKAILVPGFLGTQNVVDIKDVIAVLIVVPIILDTLAGFRQNTTRIPRRFVFEARIADPIRGGQVDCECLEGLQVCIRGGMEKHLGSGRNSR